MVEYFVVQSNCISAYSSILPVHVGGPRMRRSGSVVIQLRARTQAPSPINPQRKKTPMFSAIYLHSMQTRSLAAGTAEGETSVCRFALPLHHGSNHAERRNGIQPEAGEQAFKFSRVGFKQREHVGFTTTAATEVRTRPVPRGHTPAGVPGW